jgi:glucan phosphoethanolaminetransferase (alkaline phosphatase superfamily)
LQQNAFKKNSPNVSKLSKIVKNNFNLSFPQKQQCFDTMLVIDTTSINKRKDDKNTDFQQTFHPTLGSHKCYYKLLNHSQALDTFE